VLTIPAIELTVSESVPYKAGYRLAARYQVAPDLTLDDLYQLTIHLTAAERLALNTGDQSAFRCWLIIGIMAHHLESAISLVRS